MFKGCKGGIMVIITKFVYKAFDGKEFESKDECKEYEKKILK